MPCRVRLLKTSRSEVESHEPDEYQRLLAAAKALGYEVAVLLGGDAGLRLGEIIAQ